MKDNKTNVESANNTGWQRSETQKLQFHDFTKNPEFEGTYTGREEHWTESENEKDHWSAYVFQTPDGNEVLIGQSYAIKKAVEHHGKCQYKIMYNGKKETKSGQRVNDFDIFTREF